MGGGAGKPAVYSDGVVVPAKYSVKIARHDEREADRLFHHIDSKGGTYNNLDGRITAVEIFDAVTENHIDWDILAIKDAIAMFDHDGDGGLDRAEFKKALGAMHDKMHHVHPGAVTIRRDFTFKAHRVTKEGNASESVADKAIAEARAARQAALAEARMTLEERQKAAAERKKGKPAHEELKP